MSADHIPSKSRESGPAVDSIDLLRLNLSMRLFDREVSRKDMLEKSAYFLTTILGLLISAGLLQAKNLVESAQFVTLQIGTSIIPTLFIDASLFFACSLLFCVFQATRIRVWHPGMPPDLRTTLYPPYSEIEPKIIIEVICNYILAGHDVAYRNNNAKARWVQYGFIFLSALFSLFLAALITFLWFLSRRV